MAIELTQGAVAMLSNREGLSSDVRPVMQVVDIRLVNAQNQNTSNDRYRILLSDGLFLQQGMLATQRNELVRSEKLQKGSIVQLNQFVCNLIQNRMIIIIIDLDVILVKCDPIGDPKHFPPKTDGEPQLARSPPPMQQSFANRQPSSANGNPQNFGNIPSPKVNTPGGPRMHPHETDFNANSHSYGPSSPNNPVISRPSMNSHARPPQPSSYQQPPPMYMNRGPVAKNEAPPRIIPIAALNPYQGRWTIKARVTAKGELRHYNNPRGDGKVFSFDLLDSDGGEIRVTCFNAVADQFYHQIEPGKVYLISKGSLKPAQKAFNHLRNDHEIFLESTSTVQICHDDDNSIPHQQFHFRLINEIESMENNTVMDLIGIVSSISPSSSIMRKNGTETQRRNLYLKDTSGRSVELTLWGNFANSEGQTLQNICDSGVFPVLAVKSGRVNDFNGKAVGTISSSQLFIEPDFPEARRLRSWFDNEGKNTPSVSISRETTSMGRLDVRKFISQIKDERLGTSEKPDWITVCATLSFIKVDNFCYTACPIMIGDRQCNKKVTNNGDGKWRCDRCDQTVDDCDYRYILQFQIQDHTGLTWVTAFQECGEEIMGVSAKELYFMKYEEQEDERFAEIVRNVLFTKYVFKLKVKEEMFSDEQRVKSTVVKAEKVNFLQETRFLLESVNKLARGDDPNSVSPKIETPILSTGRSNAGYGNNYTGNSGNFGSRETGAPANQYSGGLRVAAASSGGMFSSCNSCGGTGHSSGNCPSVMSVQGQSYGGGYGNRVSSYGGGGGGGGGASSECFKCHQFGHWARDCPGLSNAAPAAYGGGSGTPARYGGGSRQYGGSF